MPSKFLTLLLFLGISVITYSQTRAPGTAASFQEDFNAKSNNYTGPKPFDVSRCTLRFEYSMEHEIYDAYGNLMVQGDAIEADISQLPQGMYYIICDGIYQRFVKRKCKEK